MRWTLAFAVLGCVCASGVRAEVVTIGAAADNTLYEDASGSLSNGAGEYLFAGTTLEPFVRRGLVRFDVAGAVPAGATITSATVGMTMSRGGSSPYAVGFHRALSDWGEGTSDALLEEGAGAPAEAGDATWLHTMYPGVMWATPGGDFWAAASVSKLVAGEGAYVWPSTGQMVADVQGMLANPAGNFGWVILGDEASIPTAKRFNSREHADVSTRPWLMIEYEIPGPGAGAAMGGGCLVMGRRGRG